ncbi:MAG TPA: hypothetical protein VHY21_00460 [Pseudonocardiaceae bacterium]|nr:hypothetical protein [Pseudonocardiaceae bacterium]
MNALDVARPPGSVAAAVDVLAGAVARAVSGADGAFGLDGVVGGWSDPVVGLAAVRVLGADALAPFLFTGRPLSASDVEVTREALRVFPAPHREDPGDARVWRCRDWALGEVLAHLGVSEPRTDQTAAALDSDGGDGFAGQPPWLVWSATVTRLAMLALPAVGGPVREQVRRRQRDIWRGLARAMLRHDHLSAARLARWLALDAAVSPESSPESLLGAVLCHLELFTAPPPRVRLEIALARRLVEDGQ